MLKMVDGTGIIGVDMICPLGGAVSPPQPPNYDKVEVEGVGSLMLPNSLEAPLERLELIGNSTQGENPAPDNPQEIKSAGKWNEGTQKYEVDVKVTGKNLLDIKDITSETPQWLEIPCLIKNNIYIKSNNSTVLVENNQARLIVCFKDGTSRAMYDNSMTNGLPFKANSENPITTIKVRGTHIKSGVYSGIQVEYGNEPTPYEPYTEQSVQIALDEPLRGIGEYKDVLTKDGVARKIKRIVFDGSKDEKWDIAIERENVINFVSTQFSDAIKINEHQRSMIDKLKWVSGVWNRDEVGQDMFAGILRINMPKTLTPDLQTFRTWLSQNPLTVDYVLAEPVTEPLPESVQAQLTALHSENGVTHVFVDSGEVPCGIKLTYRKEI